VLKVAPTFADTQWSVVPGANGGTIDITGQLANAGVEGAYKVTVTWSDGTTSEATIYNGPNGWVFSFNRPATAGLRPVQITATDIHSPSTVRTMTFGAAGKSGGKQGSLEPRNQAGPPRPHFAATAPSVDLALALGVGAAALVARPTANRVRPTATGGVMILSGSKDGEGQTSDWLCIDAMLAANLAGYERAKATAANSPAQTWRLPDDWKLALTPSPEAQALAQGLVDAIGDNDDWLVLDSGGRFSEAAE
jgi:hypothetical protein